MSRDFVHTGDGPGEAPPKHPEAETWYGIAYDKIVPEGTSMQSEWTVPEGLDLIDERTDQPSEKSQRVNSVKLSGGRLNQTYLVTNWVTYGGETVPYSMLITVRAV